MDRGLALSQGQSRATPLEKTPLPRPAPHSQLWTLHGFNSASCALRATASVKALNAFSPLGWVLSLLPFTDDPTEAKNQRVAWDLAQGKQQSRIER